MIAFVVFAKQLIGVSHGLQCCRIRIIVVALFRENMVRCVPFLKAKIRETVKEIVVPVYVETAVAVGPKQPAEKKLIFGWASDDLLLSVGVPTEWLNDVRNADEDTLLTLIDHLPGEAAEKLLGWATKPRRSRSGTATRARFSKISIGQAPPPSPTMNAANPFDHPDAQRRFRVLTNSEELQRALEFPGERWTVFLHPIQRKWVEGSDDCPVCVSGSAGTGKTIVALHRAAYLAHTHTNARVLLTTFSDSLAHALQTKLNRLVSSEPDLRERIGVYSLNSIGLQLYRSNVGQTTIAAPEITGELMREAASAAGGHEFNLHFLFTEWEQVVDAWQLRSWKEYRDVVRFGTNMRSREAQRGLFWSISERVRIGLRARLDRKARLREARYRVLWSIFERVHAGLRARQLITHAELFNSLAATISKNKNLPFDFVVADDAQDISIAQLRFPAALGGGRPDALFFTRDLGQRIFRQLFSWKAVGMDVPWWSMGQFTLRVNYRTSNQIRVQADCLLGPEVSDGWRDSTISVFNGPTPTICSLKNESEEIKTVGNWIAERTKDGLVPHEFGVFVRSAAELDRACAGVKEAGLAFKILDEDLETIIGHVSIGTMHLDKGLEFRAVVVMACDDEIIPLQERIETVGDNADLQEVYDTERHLLYVACTRARDHLLVSGVHPVSEFLDDFVKGDQGRTPHG